MYEALLFAHSWTRWVVFFGFCFLLFKTFSGWIKKSDWTPFDTQFVWAFYQAFGFQVLFGLTLYFGVSPLVKAALFSFPESLQNPVLKFWSMYHITLMLISFFVFIAGRNISNKKFSVQKRYKPMALTTLFSFLILICAIPWPFLEHGRPWMRFF